MEKILFGRIEDISKGNGWIFGHFQEAAPFKNDAFEVQFAAMKKGQRKEKGGVQAMGRNKQAKTLTFLIKGKTRIIFPEENKEVTLKEKGDYCYSAEGVFHTWEVLEDCEVVSVRWPSIKDDQETKPYAK